MVGIRSTGSTLRLLEAVNGDVRLVDVMDATLEVEDRPKMRRTRVIEVDLAEFARLSDGQAREVLATWGIPALVAGAQSIWVFREGGQHIFVPSQVFIQALLGKSRGHRCALFSPARYQLISNLAEGQDGLSVAFPAPIDKRPPERYVGLVPTILWTSTYPSAMRMHSSVLRNALDGRFDIDLPLARLTASFAGELSRDGGMLATSIRLVAVEPLEPPLAHANGLVPARFSFAVVAHTQLKKSSRKKRPKALPNDPALAHPQFAVPLEDVEWESLRAIMLSNCAFSRRIGPIEREKVNIIIRKLSTGEAWATAAGSATKGKCVWAYLNFLQANGSWEAIRSFLLTARGGLPGDGVDVAVVTTGASGGETDTELSPERVRHLRIEVAKMTQVDFASQLGVCAELVSQWERGVQSPRGTAAKKLRTFAASNGGCA